MFTELSQFINGMGMVTATTTMAMEMGTWTGTMATYRQGIALSCLYRQIQPITPGSKTISKPEKKYNIIHYRVVQIHRYQTCQEN